MRRSVHPDEILSEADARTERAKVAATKGPDVPCHRWDDKANAFVPALEARTFRLTNLGIPSAVFFVARDEPTETELGKTPIFATYEFDSGSKLPTRGNEEREKAVESAKGFLLSVDEGQRVEAVQSLRKLGRTRGRK